MCRDVKNIHLARPPGAVWCATCNWKVVGLGFLWVPGTMSGRSSAALAGCPYRIAMLLWLLLHRGTLQHKAAVARTLLNVIRQAVRNLRKVSWWSPAKWPGAARMVWYYRSRCVRAATLYGGDITWWRACGQLSNRNEPPPTHLELALIPAPEFDRTNLNGHTLLTLACELGSLQCVQSLLALGATPGPVPMSGAAQQHLAQLCETARKAGYAHPASERNPSSDPCALGGATVALTAGHHALVRELIAQGAPFTRPPLRQFVRRVEQRAVQWELMRARALTSVRRCTLRDRVVRDRLHRALRIVTGALGHLPDGPFQLIVALAGPCTLALARA